MARLVQLSLALLALLAVTGAANAAGSIAGPNYSQSGLDWGGDCQSGEKQSPINIVMDEAVEVSEPEKFVLDYDTSATTAFVVNKGSTVQVVPHPEKTYKLHINSGVYNLLQMHVHSFSEHAINGLFAAMEAHFVHVHESDPNQLAVVGAMIRLQRHDEQSAWIDTWLPKTPSEVGANSTIDIPDNFWTEMLDTSMGFWRYPGSLTTPDCNEIVEWHVLRKAKFLSVGQTITFMNMIAKYNVERTDNRLPEPVNGRTVTYYAHTSS
ncbi:hypothetical protein CLOM_g3290 [Closterium sp. NIES-68]|nr:hypothetical protein CLOM_g17093 [Closterium sp. NIES-68]GJP43890.1 hypothetical protein CLOM_g3290 [Closterium sp. NIES-68]GJP68362.1 hypothetical protein CLOP_g25081 [Closterium sp. NIES-67]GJP73082.1 hypothetical protein CLOP_g3833 [Closterium sp. NIES-67]